jgi:uncharacterized membrane protein
MTCACGSARRCSSSALAGTPPAVGRAKSRRYRDRLVELTLEEMLSRSLKQLRSRIGVADLALIRTQDIDSPGEGASLYRARHIMSNVVGELRIAAIRMACTPSPARRSLLRVTLHLRDLAGIPAETAALGQKLLAPTNPYRVIGEHLADILDDAQFADLYDATGRAAISPSLLALVTLFQFMENIPDREAAEQVVVRLDWK